VTFLPATVQGRWFYLYLILDIYSRKIVGFEVHDTDSADHAAHLVRRTALAETIHAMPEKPVLHGDNGATLKGTTVLAMLHWLGIEPSYSRPRISDDNPYAEALFRTAKYRPEFPVKGFAELDAARQWAERFVHWYNDEHRHWIRDPGSASRRPGSRLARGPTRALPTGTPFQSTALERPNPRLDAGDRGHAQSRARQCHPGDGHGAREPRTPDLLRRETHGALNAGRWTRQSIHCWLRDSREINGIHWEPRATTCLTLTAGGEQATGSGPAWLVRGADRETTRTRSNRPGDPLRIEPMEWFGAVPR
jgi:hypothetical protein